MAVVSVEARRFRGAKVDFDVFDNHRDVDFRASACEVDGEADRRWAATEDHQPLTRSGTKHSRLETGRAEDRSHCVGVADQWSMRKETRAER